MQAAVVLSPACATFISDVAGDYTTSVSFPVLMAHARCMVPARAQSTPFDLFQHPALLLLRLPSVYSCAVCEPCGNIDLAVPPHVFMLPFARWAHVPPYVHLNTVAD